MSRTPDPVLAARNQRLVEDKRQNLGVSDAVLGERHGLKQQRVRQILSDFGLISSANRRKPTRTVDMKSRSNIHALIGKAIQEKYNTAMEARPTPGTAVISGEQKFRDVARELKFTVQTLHRVTSGLENITLSDLQRIAEWLGTTPTKLLADCDKKATLYFVKKPVTTGSYVASTT